VLYLKAILKSLEAYMKKAQSKLIIALLVVVMLVGFTACAKTAEVTTEPATDTAVAETPVSEAPAATPLTGEITVSGSTSVEPVGTALGDEFMALNPGVTFTYEGIGSSAGVKNANDGTTMIGTASREIKEDEKALGLTEQELAYDGIAVIVNPANGVADLTMEQILGIYNGEITNWSEVGGADSKIAVIAREDGSGTRGAFEELVGFADAMTASAIIKDGNGNVQSTVAGNPLAIGYVSFTYLDSTVKALTVGGVEPTVAAVLDKTYPISRPFMIIYHEENLSDAAKAFLAWVETDEAKDIISEKGAIPLE
jgi:phosphate transport system substrate-binding protein